MTMGVKAILFSKDRAMQLDAALRSCYLHCQDAELVDVSVLYAVSNRLHDLQYQELIQDYPQVKFISQTDFRDNVISWLNPYPGGSQHDRIYWRINAISAAANRVKIYNRALKIITYPFLSRFFLPSLDQFTLFLVDDNIFLQDFSITNMTHALQDNPKAAGFSMRLGKNTTYCYSNNSPQPIPKFILLSNKILRFNWTTGDHDFGYPLEISSSLYRTSEIIPLLLSLSFHNPNSLEEQMAANSRIFAISRPSLLCFEESATFCNPINKVQTYLKNRSGDNRQYSADELAARFENGERIDVESYANLVPNGCHQEVEPVFKRYSSIKNHG